jgi:hypothetical protein
MQRNGVDTRALIRYGFILAALAIYEALGTIYYLLPPLLGFWFAFVAAKKEPRYLWLAIAYLLFYEADHGLIVGSCCLFIYFFSKFAVSAIEDFIMNRVLVSFISTTIAYVGYNAFISLIYFLFGMDPVSFSWLFLYYIACESILAAAVIR